MKRAGFAALAGGAAAAAAAGLVAYGCVFRPWERRWGASDEEVAHGMPGDDVLPPTARTTTRAITIDAPPEEVWPWLAQIGYRRGGFYSYDWLENLMGLGIHSADRIVPEWQTLRVGDTISFGPQGPRAPVVAVEPGRLLVLGGYEPMAGGASWAFTLRPVNTRGTRLVTRSRTHWRMWTLGTVLSRRPAAPGMPRPSLPLNLLLYLFFEPGEFLMMRRMLLGLRARAEAHTASRRAQNVPYAAANAGAG